MCPRQLCSADTDAVDAYRSIESDDAAASQANDSLAIADVYNHFAGESLRDDDGDDDYNNRDAFHGSADPHGTAVPLPRLFSSDSSLSSLPSLHTAVSSQHRTRNDVHRAHVSIPSSPDPEDSFVENGIDSAPDNPFAGTAKTSKVFLLLLKSFIGTGVLLLPRAFLNGGLAFSFCFLLFFAVLSAHGMLLLIKSNERVTGSFGDMARALYGAFFQQVVLWSIALSQMGFCVAYMLFVCDNAATLAASFSPGSFWWALLHSAPALIAVQTIIYVPLALVRHLSRLALLSLLADVFILIGLLAVVAYSIAQLKNFGPASDVIYGFNTQSFHLYIGTSIYAFEGVSLVLPLAHSMRHPMHFPRLLIGTMALTTAVYLAVASTGYLAFGSLTKNVVLSNLPPDSHMSRAVLLIYVLAIMATWPLVLFPATRIIELAVLPGRSGALSRLHKWQKNALRIFLVTLLAFTAALFADKLDRVVSFVGSFACIPLSFIYPCLIHLRTFPNMHFVLRVIDLFMIVFGALAAIYVTYQTIFV